ncbi:MAG: 1,2-phenylacetyl-CoA epoxidase subunit PaaE [Halobacterium sp.]
MTDRDPSTTTTPDAPAECPYCGSTDTERDHPKGPGLCRSMHYCRDCEQPFERFG